MPIKYKKYKKLQNLFPEKEIFIEAYCKDYKHSIVLKIKGEKQKWLFDKSDFEKFYWNI